jgi:CRISPR-associated protein Cmr2
MINNYIGITIGPIGDAIMLTSTPAELWAASYLFTELSYQLCHLIKNELKMEVITPYFEDAEKDDSEQGHDQLSRNNGAGLLPDHIIFACSDDSITPDGAKLRDVISSAKNNVADLFTPTATENDSVEATKSRNYLMEYLQVHAMAFHTDDAAQKPEDKNVIMAAASLFSAIELEYSN